MTVHGPSELEGHVCIACLMGADHCDDPACVCICRLDDPGYDEEPPGVTR